MNHQILAMLSDKDLTFLIETLLPERRDVEHLREIIRDDQDFVQSMLGSDALFEKVMRDESILLRITPRLFFIVLLARAHRDLARTDYTVETHARESVPVFDSQKVVELLDNPRLRHYLADMLASFTRIQSVTWPVRVRKGVWHKYRVNDLDIDSLVRVCASLDEGQRFQLYKRIADVCLFLTGMFPEYVHSAARMLEGTRFAFRASRTLEEYEQDGRRFYRLAAVHEAAYPSELRHTLDILSSSFNLAEKPLRFLSLHYLHTRKHNLFSV